MCYYPQVIAWDVLSNLGNDYKLLFKHRISLPSIVYVVSR